MLQRNDMRDRFIRLWGNGDIPRATAALGEAGRRISRYLLGQLVVNLTFGALMAGGRHEAVEMIERLADTDGLRPTVRDLLMPAGRSLAADLGRGALDHADAQRASRVLVAAAEAIHDAPETGEPSVLWVGAGAALDHPVATALAASLASEGFAAAVAASPRVAAPCETAVLVLARHASPRRVRRTVARLRAAIGRAVPVLVLAEGGAGPAVAASASGARHVAAPEAVGRMVRTLTPG